MSIACLLLGGLTAWVTRHAINPDGMAYLDLAEEWGRGDTSDAVNSYWSPLYSWLLAAGLKVVDPSPAWEFALAHGVNFAVYALALACFAFLLRNLLALRRERLGEEPPAWAAFMVAGGFAVFAWASLRVLSVEVLTPDLFVAAMVFLATGLIARIRLERAGTRAWLALGAALGAAYLAKAAMFPMAFVILGAAAIAAGGFRRAGGQMVLAALVFAAMSAPLVASLSHREGHLTFGESGAINYAWNVNKLDYPYWHGGTPGHGRPEHPPQLLATEPATYAFAGPVPGSAPLWVDPSHWYAGVRPDVNAADTVRAVGRNLRRYATMGSVMVVLALLAAAAFLGRGRERNRARRLDHVSLLLAPLAALALYLPVHVSPRYVGAWFAVIAVVTFAAVRLPGGGRRRTGVIALAGLAALVMAGSAAQPTLSSLRAEVFDGPAENRQWEIARELNEIGLGAGDRVATVGRVKGIYDGGAAPQRSTWARLAGVRVAADVAEPQALWNAAEERQAAVYRELSERGVDALVSENPPPADEEEPWRPVSATGHHALLLDGSYASR